MAPKITFDNFARRGEAPAVASAGSDSPSGPARNMLTSDLAEVWRSYPGDTATWLQIDLDGPEEIDTICIAGTNLTPGAAWRIVIGTGDLTDNANASYIKNMGEAGIVDPWGLAVHYLPAPATGESVRLNLQDDSLDYLEVGRVWIGRSWAPTTWYDFGSSQGFVDNSVRTKSLGGTTFIDERPIARTRSLTFPSLDAADADRAEEMMRLVGTSREMLVCFDEDSPKLGKDTFLALPTNMSLSRVSPKWWSLSLDLEERL